MKFLEQNTKNDRKLMDATEFAWNSGNIEITEFQPSIHDYQN